MRRNVSIAVAALLVVGLVFVLGHYFGASSNPTEKIDELKNTLKEERQDHRDTIKDRDDAHRKEISDKNAEIERRENEYKQALDKKDRQIASLEAKVLDLNTTNKTLTVVCIALGTAVVVALFVGTLMGAKGRRDAVRVCKDRDASAEEVA